MSVKWKKIKKDVLIFNIIGYIIVSLAGLLCIFPFLLTISGSLTDENALSRGLRLIPEKFSLEAYILLLEDSTALFRAYGVTITLVIVGTTISLFLVTMTAYVLQRQDFVNRNYFLFYFFFTTLFSGGLIPYYMLITKLGLRNTFFAMVVPGMFSVFNMIIVKTFFRTNVPVSIGESAQIDGANDFLIYYKLYLPLSLPVIATIGLFSSIGFWNEWYHAMLYISDKNLYPLQYFLYKIFNSMKFAEQLAEFTGARMRELPHESFKLAMTVFTIGPVVLFYPFAQKYFIRGMTIGAIKG